jgi:serine/threonine-protein phosphatase 2B catalytic subunit
MELFDSMPVCALISDKYFAVHGGISPKLGKLNTLDVSLNRFHEVPYEGLFCDLLWSDPVSDADAPLIDEFGHNSDRDCSFFYGKYAVKKVLE